MPKHELAGEPAPKSILIDIPDLISSYYTIAPQGPISFGTSGHRGSSLTGTFNESHIAFHTYPEARHASIDIFHCSPNSEFAFRLLKCLSEKLQSQDIKFIEVSRGDKLGIKK